LQVALHPNDPPVPVSRGSEQLMASFAQWKEYINLVKSPYNGMTFDCGVSRGDGRGSGRGCKVAG
jgi:mannonate dehydratase